MTDNSFYILIDVFVAGCGIYVIAQYLFMVKTRSLRQNMMLPKELSVEKCKDVEGYIKAIGTKLLLFGIAATVCGCISLVQDFAGFYNIYVSMGAMVVFIVLCIWYGRESKKAIDKFW
ncbi:MAG: hypothetical protein LUG99_18865 [Lachnospiraceae bacterium]|nr:hypothetical protein [Lachnospiraceae bacterium]